MAPQLLAQEQPPESQQEPFLRLTASLRNPWTVKKTIPAARIKVEKSPVKLSIIITPIHQSAPDESIQQIRNRLSNPGKSQLKHYVHINDFKICPTLKEP
jgi:hypothetical protein